MLERLNYRVTVCNRADVPVILVSGYSPELKPENLRAAGICELLEKPAALTALADVSQRALA